MWANGALITFREISVRVAHFQNARAFTAIRECHTCNLMFTLQFVPQNKSNSMTSRVQKSNLPFRIIRVGDELLKKNPSSSYNCYCQSVPYSDRQHIETICKPTWFTCPQVPIVQMPAYFEFCTGTFVMPPLSAPSGRSNENRVFMRDRWNSRFNVVNNVEVWLQYEFVHRLGKLRFLTNYK